MIFILSKKVDVSTDEVLRCLLARKVSFFRFDLLDVILEGKLSIKINERGFEINLCDNIITNENLNQCVFWYRKQTSFLESLRYGEIKRKVGEDMAELMNSEYVELKELFYLLTKGAKWLCFPSKISKVYVLYCASLVGLNIPITYLMGEKKKLALLYREYNKKEKTLVCKTVGNGFRINALGKSYLISPHVVGSLDNVPSVFFPSMVQEYIDKEFDIRVFLY